MSNRIAYLGRLVGLSTYLCVLICCSSLKGDLTTEWSVLSQKTVGHPPPFTSIIFFDEFNGLGLSPLGLGSTTDGGSTWKWQLENGNRGLYSMKFVDRQLGWIVGAESKVKEGDSSAGQINHKPLILRTEDGGITWNQINIDRFLGSNGAGFSTFLSICRDRAGSIWLAGNAGIVQGAIESNELRVGSITTTKAVVNDLSCNNSEEVWAVGDKGLIMHYQQKQWTSNQYPDDSAFYNKVKIMGNAVWLVGGTRVKGGDVGQGLLLKSADGNSWENKTPRDAGLLFDLAFTGNEGWLVGAPGSLYYTNNGGAAWQKEKSPTENDLFSVFFLNAKRGWIGGDKLTVLGQNTH